MTRKAIFLTYFLFFFIMIFAVTCFAMNIFDMDIQYKFIFPFSAAFSCIGAAIAAIAVPAAKEIEAYQPQLDFKDKPIKEIQDGLKKIKYYQNISDTGWLIFLFPYYFLPKSLTYHPLFVTLFCIFTFIWILSWHLVGGVKCPRCDYYFHTKSNPRGLRIHNSFKRACLNCGLRLDGKNISSKDAGPDL